jgi:hypothetical protein
MSRKPREQVIDLESFQVEVRRIIRDINMAVASLQVLMDDATYLAQKIGVIQKPPDQAIPKAEGPKQVETASK